MPSQTDRPILPALLLTASFWGAIASLGTAALAAPEPSAPEAVEARVEAVPASSDNFSELLQNPPGLHETAPAPAADRAPNSPSPVTAPQSSAPALQAPDDTMPDSLTAGGGVRGRDPNLPH